jgi:hypothetical protein
MLRISLCLVGYYSDSDSEAEMLRTRKQPAAKVKKVKKKVKKKKKVLSLLHLAEKLTYFDCGCGRQCLAKCAGRDKDISASAVVLSHYIADWRYMHRRQHREHFQHLVEGLTTGLSSGKERQGTLRLVFSVSHQHDVCPKAFAKAHLRGHTYYDEVCCMQTALYY